MYSYSWHIIVPDALSTSSANEEAALQTLCYENWPRNECTNNQLQILEINIIGQASCYSLEMLLIKDTCVESKVVPTLATSS